MTTVRESRITAPLAMLLACHPASGQNSLDLDEAEARDAAYTMLRAVEERFDCQFEEDSVRKIGYTPAVRFVFYVNTEGHQCHEAMIFVTDLAARGDKVVFRRVNLPIERIEQPLILDGRDQVLIHEVNPDIGENNDPGE